MIDRALEINARLDDWQRKGGTPRWFVYQWIRTAPRMAITALVLVLILYLFTVLSTEPGQDLRILGVGFLALVAFHIGDKLHHAVLKLREQ